MNQTFLKWLTSAAALMLIFAFCLVFLYAPNDLHLGVVQKVFYFHLPSAIAMYASWMVCAVASVGYLLKRNEKWDMAAVAAGEIALMFAVILMTTGPIWGRKSWGAYWTWDPRLTSALLLTLIIVGYVVLRKLGTEGGVERRFGAALAILGAALIPVIHISVNKWRGQHPNVLGRGGGGMAPEMMTVLWLSLAGFALFFLVLLLYRYKLEKNRRRILVLKEEIAIFGIHLEGGQ